jgi:heme exporter protein A
MYKLHVDRVGKRFGTRILFKRLSFAAAPGRTVAITGSNGSGKSTLVRILAGVMRPTRGRVSLEIDGTTVDDPDLPMHVGMVAPYLNLYDAFTPRENLRFVARARQMKNYADRIDQTLEDVFLLNRSEDAVGTFSSGMKQRMRFAFALFSSPAVLLLDEPTANLDAAGIEMVNGMIARARDGGQIVIVATNDAVEAAACDETICVEDFR